MKKTLTLFSIMLAGAIALNAQTQVTNGGFEDWTIATTPDDWETLESSAGLTTPMVGLVEKDNTDKVAGNLSAKISTKQFTDPQNPPALITQTGVLSFGSLDGTEFSALPDTLYLSYKYKPVGSDTAAIGVAVHTLEDGWILDGGVSLLSTNGAWANIFVPLINFYNPSQTGGTVDSFVLFFVSSATQVNVGVGSELHVDEVSVSVLGGGSSCTPPTVPNGVTASSFSIEAGETVTLSLNNTGVGDGEWVWYEGACGGSGTEVGRGASITVTPTAASTTYFVRGEGCGSVTSCGQQMTINVNYTNCTAPGVPNGVTASSFEIEVGESVTLSLDNTGVGDGQWVWYAGDCGVGASVGTGATLVVSPTTTTTYYVRGEGCGISSSCGQQMQIIVNNTTVGIADVATFALTVTPNPAKDVLFLNSENDLAGFNFSIMDITGRVVSTTILNGRANTINIAELSNGNYIYGITNQDNHSVKHGKFVIAK